MGLFKSIHEALENEFTLETPLTLEQAYEQLYDKVDRLRDMDDFSASILRSIYTKMQQGLSFTDAFKEVINNDYEFADFDYFKDVFEIHKENLLDLLKKSVNSSNPSRIWSSEILWIFEHYTIEYNGSQYTLNQLKEKLDKGDENSD